MNDWFRMELEASEFSSYYGVIIDCSTFFYTSCSLFHCSKYVQEKAFAIMYSLLILGDICSISGDYDSITVMMSKLGLANMWG